MGIRLFRCFVLPLLLCFPLLSLQADQEKTLVVVPPILLSSRCQPQIARQLHEEMFHWLLNQKFCLVHPNAIQQEFARRNLDLGKIIPPSEYQIILEDLNSMYLIVLQLTECSFSSDNAMMPSSKGVPVTGHLSGSLRLIGPKGKMTHILPFDHQFQVKTDSLINLKTLRQEQEQQLLSLFPKEMEKLLPLLPEP